MNIGQSWIAAWSAFSLLTAPGLSSAISEERGFASPYQFKRVSLDDIQDIPDFGVAQRENDVAVVIGVEKYLNHLPPSDFSAGDASLVKGYLKALGVPERNIEFLINEMATQSAIVKSIERVIPNKAKKDSRVFIYYSGHGSPDPATGEGFIVPHDGDPNYLSETGYSLKRLYEKLGKLQVAEVVVILDSCFSGAGGRSVLAKGARPLVMTSAEPGNLPSNLAILAATQGNQISISSPEKGHGILTYHFLKAIKGGKNELAKIYEEIKPLIEDEAKAVANVQQSPSLMPSPDQLKGRFVFPTYAKTPPLRKEGEKESDLKLREERKKFEGEKLRLEEEKRKLREKELESEKKLQEKELQLKKEMASKEEERQRQFEEERKRIEREKKQLEDQKSGKKKDEPIFVPPTF